VRRITSPRVGVLDVPELRGRTGDHWAQGFAVALGPNASVGEVPQRVSIVDIAPTICAVLGEALPQSDGVVVPAMAAALRPGECSRQ
jgi:predicted AlkP superfamily phosphohydrolase/phosphomutase